MTATDANLPPDAREDAIDEAFCEYLRCLDAGEAFDQESFLARYLDIADSLAKYLRTESVVQELAGPTFGETSPDVLATVVGFSQDSALRDTATLTPSLDTQSPEAEAEWGIPPTFGRYRVKKLLGQGAMGAVYLAHDTQLDRDVALKIPKFDHRSDAGLLERFYREARAVATLHHPHICPVYDVGEIEKQTFLSMAFIQGRPLADFAKSSKKQGERSVAKLVMKLAQALQEAHDIGVVHRDLKPANIMVSKKGEPVVMDFGLARRLDSNEIRITQSGFIVGTPAYMSPEQVEGHPDAVGPSSDQFSLGVILYELLAGRLPFQGSVLSVIGQIAHKEPSQLEELRPDLNARLTAICRKMMSKSPDDRYESMTAVAAALGSYLVESKAASPPENHSMWDIDKAVSITESVPPAKRRLPKKTLPGKKPKQGGKKHQTRRWLLFAGASALFAILAGVVIFFQNADGTVRIEINDPGIEVSFQGQTFTFDDNGTEIQVTPGPHTMSVKRGSLNFTTQEFTVSRRGKVAIEVTWLNGELKVQNDDIVIGSQKMVPQSSSSAESHLENTNPKDQITLVRKLKGHKDGGARNSLSLSADGSLLLSAGGRDRTAILWDLKTGGSLAVLSEHSFTVSAVAISADGQVGLTADYSGKVHLWNLQTFQKLREIQTPERMMTSVRLLPDGEQFAVAAPGAVSIWELATGKELRRLEIPGYIFDMDVMPGGRSLLASTSEAWLCNLDTGEKEVSFCRGMATACFSQDGLLMVTGHQGSDKGDVKLWDLANRREIRRFLGHKETLGGVAFLPGEKHLISAGWDGTIRIWDVQTGEEVARLEGLGHLAQAVIPLPDGKHALSFGGPFASPRPDPMVNDWDIRLWRLPESVWPETKKGG